MYGDPRGYKETGQRGVVSLDAAISITDRLAEIYFWSMDPKDLERVPKTGWIGFLEGKEPQYPEQALRQDLEFVRAQSEGDASKTPRRPTRGWRTI